jgi:hypothetical protein
MAPTDPRVTPMEGSMGELLTADWEAFTGDQVVEGSSGRTGIS